MQSECYVDGTSAAIAGYHPHPFEQLFGHYIHLTIKFRQESGGKCYLKTRS